MMLQRKTKREHVKEKALLDKESTFNKGGDATVCEVQFPISKELGLGFSLF